MAKGYASAWVITMVLLGSSAPVAAADPEPGAVREPAAQPGAVPRSSRLRFRSGPICMCADGLGEAEIEAAERKRLDAIVQERDVIRR